MRAKAVRVKWIIVIVATRNSIKIYSFLLEINSLANTINADEDQKKWRRK